jgi:hypothetical protein
MGIHKRVVPALVFGLAVVAASPAIGGSTPVTPFGSFTTFTFDAAGPIENTGPGQSQQVSDLATTFDLGITPAIGLPPLSQFSLTLTFSGPGAPLALLPDLTTACSPNFVVNRYECSFDDQFTFAPNALILPGTVFGAQGVLALAINGLPLTLDTASDSFTSFATPEPGMLALLAAGLSGLAVLRRRRA